LFFLPRNGPACKPVLRPQCANAPRAWPRGPGLPLSLGSRNESSARRILGILIFRRTLVFVTLFESLQMLSQDVLLIDGIVQTETGGREIREHGGRELTGVGDMEMDLPVGAVVGEPLVKNLREPGTAEMRLLLIDGVQQQAVVEDSGRFRQG